MRESIARSALFMLSLTIPEADSRGAMRTDAGEALALRPLFLVHKWAFPMLTEAQRSL
jgi:hypothetical protein